MQIDLNNSTTSEMIAFDSKLLNSICKIMIRLNKVMIEGRIVDAERYLECKVYIAEPMEKFTSAAKPYELVRHQKLKPK